MPSDHLQITRSVLLWARERAGYSIDDLEDKFARIRDWESGDSGPTYPQLEELAKKLDIPVAAFFLPRPPNLPRIRESFRTLPEVEFNRLPPSVLALIRRAKAMQINLEELAGNNNPAERLITRDLQLTVDAAVPQAADSIRQYLGVPIDDQLSWRDPESALKHWRDAVQDTGVFVFKDAFHANDYSGFSLSDPVFPVIFINNSNAKSRQTFTLFHELAHLLLNTSAIDRLDDRHISQMADSDKRIEIFCNKVAGEILVPIQAFADAMSEQPRTRQTARDMAAHFSVSREVIYRKFLDLGWIDAAEYRAAIQDWAPIDGQTGSGGNYYFTKIAYLGDSYIRLALRPYFQEQIDDRKLSDYLDVKPRNVATLIEKFLSVSR